MLIICPFELSELCRPHVDYEKERWQNTPLSESSSNGEQSQFNSPHTETNLWPRIQWLDGSNWRLSAPYSRNTPQSFSRGTRSYAFLRSTKHVKTSYEHTPKISQKFAGEWNYLLCIATAGTKTALGIFQVWFNYFAASFFKALGNVNINFLKIPKKRRRPHKRPSQATCGPRAACLRPLS